MLLHAMLIHSIAFDELRNKNIYVVDKVTSIEFDIMVTSAHVKPSMQDQNMQMTVVLVVTWSFMSKYNHVIQTTLLQK